MKNVSINPLKEMKQMPLILAVLLCAFYQSSFAQKNIRPVLPDRLEPAVTAKIDGYVGSKFDASYYNRILAQDANRLIEPFTVRDEDHCWQSEFWGKWFTSAVLAYRYKPTEELALKLRQAVDGLIATQSSDGYIGNYAPESRLKAWDIWGRKYCMLGLIAYYDLTGYPAALDAAAKEADCLMDELTEKNAKIVRMGNHRGMAASSVLEPICQLYQRTGNTRYLDFAEEIVRQWETSDGPQLISKAAIPVGKRFPKPDKNNWYGWEQGQKAYEMMSCYEGLLELHRLTGKKEYRKAAEETWQSIMDTELNIVGSGSAMEAWFSGKEHQTVPIEHYQETCVTVTWLKFTQQLFRLTGDAKYADAIERTFYNALLGAMRPDGSDWAKYTPLYGQRLKGSEQCDMGLNCCNASGPRGLFTLPRTAVMQADSGLYVNFYMEGSYVLKTPQGKPVTLTQKTDYPLSGKVDISFALKKNETMLLALRIPKWSEDAKVTVNGMPVDHIKAGEYLKLNQKWEKNNSISIEFEMKGKIHRTRNNPSCVAITRGPIVLARDERLEKNTFPAIITPITTGEDEIKLTREETSTSGVWMRFSASFLPESYTEYGAKAIEIPLCDYASAGNATDGYPFFKVWLLQLYDPRAQETRTEIPTSVMNRIYEEIKTPYKYGLVIVPPDQGKMVDSPTVFKHNGQWHMTYIVYDGTGYETWLAQSSNLLSWKTLGKIMSFTKGTWDANQKAGYMALQDYRWGGSYEVEPYQGKYWMSYLGGDTPGYEAGVLGIGMACADDLTAIKEWQRTDSPVLSATDADARWYDNASIYKSSVINDRERTTGHPFVMFYNAKGRANHDGEQPERIAMAVSDDMIHWKRWNNKPVIDHEKGISGDAFLAKIDDVWVMFYFGAFWKPKAFERFACSYDLANWTKWEGEDLIAPSEPYDDRYAHKPCVIKHDKVAYHFYCAVNEKGERAIALATSADLGKSTLTFPKS